jgi:hypothetical protein
LFWRHQIQLGEPHVFHRTRDRTDIAGMRCIDENYAEVIERIHG